MGADASAMHNYMRDTLEAIVKEKFAKAFELPQLAGYPYGTTTRAVSELHKLDLIWRGSGFWSATERGKILLAVMIGKEAKMRARRFRMAA